MKKIFSVILIISILTFSTNSLVYSKEKSPDLKAKAALMVDLSTGRYLYKSNETTRIEPGSLVKIMTAIVAIEHIKDMNKSVVADINVLSSYDYSFGHMGILPNEKLTYENLLHGMLLYDAGDAAEVIANSVMGSKKEFIKEMNNKAVEIGALNTKFTNPTGFPQKNQYSTAEDIYKITKYAMENSYFREVVGKSRYEMPPTNKYTQYRYLDNKNKFMSSSATDKYFTSKAKGVKSSYVNDNNCSLVLQYESSSIDIMTIVLKSAVKDDTNNSYEDTLALLNYGLNYYTSVRVIDEGDIFEEVELKNGKGVDRILLEAKEDVNVNLPKDYDEEKLETKVSIKANISAPLKKGQELGTVKIIYDGEEYISTKLTSPQNIEANNFKGVFNAVWSFITAPVLIVIMGLLLIVVVWCFLIFNRKKVYKIDKK